MTAFSFVQTQIVYRGYFLKKLDIWISICYNNNSGRDTTITGQDEKGEAMDGMTNEQYADVKETLIKFILEILDNSDTIEEAKTKIEALLPEK